MGAIHGYKCLNRAYGLYEAVRLGYIKQPFASIDPDTFLINPIKTSDVPLEAQKVWYMAPSAIQEFDGIDIEQEFDIDKSKWMGIGCLFVFNSVKPQLFARLFERAFEITKKYQDGDGKLKSDKSYWQRDMYAYNLAFINQHARASIQFECNLDYRAKPRVRDSNFVHYCNGFLPNFEKRHHNVWMPFSVESPLPFEKILAIPADSDEIKYFQAVVRSYLRRNPSMDDFLS
jgi:hypothetical protein